MPKTFRGRSRLCLLFMDRHVLASSPSNRIERIKRQSDVASADCLRSKDIKAVATAIVDKWMTLVRMHLMSRLIY